ncbi:tRNA-specific adenosine deaminase 2 [Enteropsectra breve]|nr:tRNA-specific adenosine deaminase 2 [Enteropsectra breve]
MDAALGEADRGLCSNEVPVGCVVVYKNEVVERSHNLTNVTSDPLAHAEFICMRRIMEDTSRYESLSELAFYITVEPCVMCHSFLKSLKAKVYFGCYNEIFGTRAVLGEEAGECSNDSRCIEILKEFYCRENMAAPEEKRLDKSKRRENMSKK